MSDEFDPVERDYYIWLIKLITGNKPYVRRGKQYSLLLDYLYNTEYIYIIPNDSNRLEDGRSLRYYYRYGHNIAKDDMDEHMKGQCHCSVLEMLVGLAYRIENNIQYNEALGDRTGLWFWTMLDSMGLDSKYMNSDKFNDLIDEIDVILLRFMTNTYEPNGKGGLFTFANPSSDISKEEIWRQMNWWFSERYNKVGG